MSLNTILATTPLTSTGYHLKATGTTIGNSLIWDNGTNVGISTITAASKLEVSSTNQGNSVTYGSIFNVTTATAINDRLNINFSQNGNNDRARAAIGAVAELANGLASSLAFYTRYAADGSSLATTDERMRITSSGDVSINSAITTYGKLSIKQSGSLDYNGINLYSNNGTETFLGIGNTGTTMGLNANYGGSGAYIPLTFTVGGSERMRLLTNGNVSIGLASDGGAKLYVGGTFTASTTLASGYAHTLSNQSLAAGANGVFIDAYSASSSSWALAIRTNDGNSYPLRVRCDGNILANASVYNNTSGGSPRNIFMGTDYYFAGLSSIRASKKNIENVSNVDWLYQLNPVTFNYRKKDEDGNYSEEAYEDLSYGLIAEDTQPIADFLINYDDREEGGKKMIGIEYSRLITPMLKAIQEMNTKLDEQNQTIQNLQEQNQDLKSRLDKAGL